EKPSICTDKPYYYPGEIIWLKCHMLYQNPLIADTLSAVVHIDLIQNQPPKILTTFTLPIRDGVGVGQIELPDSLSPGNYSLRAYTNWSRNFGESDYSYWPVPVIGIKEKVTAQPSHIPKTATDLLVSIFPDRPSYKHRDKITLEISLTDTIGAPLNGKFTVSVTDTLQVASITSLSSMLADFEWLQQPMKVMPDRIEHQIEYGISLKGQFNNFKGKPAKASITIVQGQLENYGVVETDDLGQFWASGLQFPDSAEVAMAAIDKKGRPYGKVELMTTAAPPLEASKLSSVLLETNLTNVPQRYLATDFGKGYTMLDEVVIEKSKQTEKQYWQYGSEPNKTYGAENLASTNASNVLYALKNLYQNGSRIIADPAGRHYGFCFNSLGAPFAEPILYVDGTKYLEDRSVGDVLFDLPVEEVESIDVFTYATGSYMGRAYTGVVLITTKSGKGFSDDSARIFNSKGFSLYTLKGFNPSQDFPSPDYSLAGSEKPDYRSTIYWNPSLQTDGNTGKASFSFYAADLPTVYRVLVQGVTENKIPFMAVKYVTVR
ncbi:MAG: hypothetical protein RIE59_21560, partial [Imperialibacter sp.]